MLIVRPGLSRLTRDRLGGHAFAAAYDMIFLMDHKGGPLAREFQGYRRALGLALDTPYFNAGLMTIDRAAWRKAGYARRRRRNCAAAASAFRSWSRTRSIRGCAATSRR